MSYVLAGFRRRVAPVGGGGAQVRRLRRRRLGRDALRHVAALRARRRHQLRRDLARGGARRRRRRRCCWRWCCAWPGFGYKIAAVPFHMWCPDVYEGAPTRGDRVPVGRAPKRPDSPFCCASCAGVLPAELGRRARRRGRCCFGLIAAATMTLGNLAALAADEREAPARLLVDRARGLRAARPCVAGGRDGARADPALPRRPTCS